MHISSQDRSLSRAIGAFRALESELIVLLSIPDCAIILDALPAAPELVSVRSMLAQQLASKLQPPWIADGDLYEVFAALTALWQYDQTKVSGEQLAWAIQRLIASEAAIGGPYYSAGILAIPANTQISLFMDLVAKPLPNVEAFIRHIIAGQQFEPIINDHPFLLYLLLRASDGPGIPRYIAKHWQTPSWQSPAYQVMTLLTFDDKNPSAAIAQNLVKIQEAQLDSGLWHDAILKTPGQQLAISALAVAALSRCYHSQTQDNSATLERRQSTIKQAGHALFEGFSEPLRSTALELLDQICNADKNFEVTLLPQLFAQALNSPRPLTADQSTSLGLAGLCGWIAYTIYDDFLDTEGDPAKLPVANIAMRASVACFEKALPQNKHFQQYVARAFAAMDEANAWEIAYCRLRVADDRLYINKLPDYGNANILAERSFPHVLGPMAVLAIDSQANTSTQVHHIESAFRHYLIARQLNDDLQDWSEDIRAGQVSFVATAILNDMRATANEYYLPELLPAMQKTFRQFTMPKICRRILLHLEQARKSFTKSHLIEPASSMYILLDKLEISVHYSLDKRSKAKALYDHPKWEVHQ